MIDRWRLHDWADTAIASLTALFIEVLSAVVVIASHIQALVPRFAD